MGLSALYKKQAVVSYEEAVSGVTGRIMPYLFILVLSLNILDEEVVVS